MPPPLWGLPAAQILDVRALGFECQLANLPQREYFCPKLGYGLC